MQMIKFQYGADRKRCNDILSAEADRAVTRRFSLQGKTKLHSISVLVLFIRSVRIFSMLL